MGILSDDVFCVVVKTAFSRSDLTSWFCLCVMVERQQRDLLSIKVVQFVDVKVQHVCKYFFKTTHPWWGN